MHLTPSHQLCRRTAPRARYLHLFAIALLAAVSAAAAPAQSWSLQWSDEFNSSAGTLPDPKSWTYDTGDGGFGNHEVQYYCAAGSGTGPCIATEPKAYQDGHGNLVIKAVRNAQGKWTSARLKTQGLRDFQYGRVEARLKLPVGAGFWPAFWMLGSDIQSVGWPRCGEQDIIEWVQSYTPTTTSSTTHGPGYSGGHGIGAHFTFPNGGRVDTAFHTYGVLWGPDSIRYYRDDPSNIILTTTPANLPPGAAWAFNHPLFLLLNLAIGNNNFAGSTDDTTPATGTMLVDYVRVYTGSAPASGSR